jgi:alpha-tubulin suppressor-like RCC1 family protein
VWNFYGQCGTGTAGGNVLAATRCEYGTLADADVRVVFVACGYAHTVALTSDGGVIVFGSNIYGQLGTGNNGGLQPTPVRLACAALDGVRVVGCAAGDNFAQLVSDDGRVFATGAQRPRRARHRRHDPRQHADRDPRRALRQRARRGGGVR